MQARNSIAYRIRADLNEVIVFDANLIKAAVLFDDQGHPQLYAHLDDAGDVTQLMGPRVMRLRDDVVQLCLHPGSARRGGEMAT